MPERNAPEYADSGQRKGFLQGIRSKTTMKMNERIITAVSRTQEGIEWTNCRIKADGPEQMEQDAAVVEMAGDTPEELLASIRLPENVTEHLTGDITVSLRTSELLMRIMEFPAVEDEEISDMVGFQIDKVSPFPQDQLAISHEVLRQSEDSSLVLMAAARRSCIDAIGDTFHSTGVRVHSIDARVLGWMRLMRDDGHISEDQCEIIIIDDEIDFSLVVVADGIPVVFRTLDTGMEDATAVEELAQEIGYTLTMLETEHDLPLPAKIRFWCHGDQGKQAYRGLSEKCGIPVDFLRLAELPPLSEGIVRRTKTGESRIELVPREWIEYEVRRKLRRQFTIIASSIITVWLVVMLGFYITYKVRDVALTQVKERLEAIEPEASLALENRSKLKLLQVYTDRSDSALECLLEVTKLLPPEDIEFASYNYKKGKGVTLRGSAVQDDHVYDFFESLTESDLFVRLKDQSVNAKVIKGVRSSVFSVTLDLPGEEAGK